MRKREFLFYVVSFLFIFLFQNTCFAVSINIPQIQKDVYIYDQEKIIDDDVEKELNSLLIELEKKTSVELVVISTPSLQGMNIESYSIELANKLGIGKKSKDNGILLLFTKSEKDFGPSTRLEIGSGIEGVLNDAKCGRILDNYFIPYREKNDYTEATNQTIRAIISLLSKEYNVKILEESELLVVEEEKGTWESLSTIEKIIVIIIIIVLIFAACLISIVDDSYGGGSFRGSGFGGRGFHSGGFGGGGFHGGGASR